LSVGFGHQQTLSIRIDLTEAYGCARGRGAVYVSDYSGNCARGRLSEDPIRIQKASGTDKTPEYLILSFVHALPCLSANSEKTLSFSIYNGPSDFPSADLGGCFWQIMHLARSAGMPPYGSMPGMTHGLCHGSLNWSP